MSPQPKNRNPLSQGAAYAQVALVFPAATAIGLFVGSALDRWLHTRWLYIVGLVLGIVAGFVELIRIVSKDNQSS